MRYRRAAVGLTIALVLVGLMVYGVGWQRVLELLREANPVFVAGALLAGATILALRGLIVDRLLEPVAGSATGIAFVAAFLSGYFARSALPWGRSTGTPIMAYVLASNSESAFEDNLAVVALAEVFAFLGSLVVAVIGIGLFLTTETTATEALENAGFGGTLVTNVALAVGVGIVVVAVVVAFVRGTWARRVVIGLADRGDRLVSRLPRVSGNAPLSSRVEGFFHTLEVVSAARRTLAVAFAIGITSWLINALPLYFGLLALGVDAPIALALVCAPLASFGGILPLPGGTGGIEAVLAGLLITVGGLPADVATATTLLYRLSTYWLHLAIGGVGALYLSMSGDRTLTV